MRSAICDSARPRVTHQANSYWRWGSSSARSATSRRAPRATRWTMCRATASPSPVAVCNGVARSKNAPWALRISMCGAGAIPDAEACQRRRCASSCNTCGNTPPFVPRQRQPKARASRDSASGDNHRGRPVGEAMSIASRSTSLSSAGRSWGRNMRARPCSSRASCVTSALLNGREPGGRNRNNMPMPGPCGARSARLSQSATFPGRITRS